MIVTYNKIQETHDQRVHIKQQELNIISVQVGQENGTSGTSNPRLDVIEPENKNLEHLTDLT